MNKNRLQSVNLFSIIFRSLALFAVLYQFRFVAGELADTAVFSAMLVFAFAAAACINYFAGKKFINYIAPVIIALAPWIVRTCIAAVGYFISGNNSSADNTAVYYDSLLLNFDRNNFVVLLPFYWTSLTTWFSLRSRKFLRAAVIADVFVLIAVFSFTGVSDNAVYRWPVVVIIVLAGIIFMQVLALLFSAAPEINMKKREKIAAVAVLLVLVLLGGLLFLKPSQRRAAQKGGGLLEPKLFSFDFSQFLRLDPEISMNDDLVLIVKKDPGDNHVLLRRSVLSGYNKKQGFYRIEETDGKTHPQRLPSRPLRLDPVEFEPSRIVYQEYFLVNFDASAFIGMKEPLEIIPFENWDSSSFKQAYAVESMTSTIDGDDLSWLMFDSSAVSASFSPSPESFGLSEKEFAQYTAFGSDERIKSFAQEITAGCESYDEKIRMIHDYLKYGDYRYSLKPGIAPDGDQLAWFLFNSKKGYCSYYAFAMALMLRSLGIPSRVAAGFFIDPESGIFDYYPVRSDMAHAWVEVPYPGCGWLEFDPTTEYLAEGEDFRFSPGTDPNLLERLMREIFENRSKLRVKMGPDGRESLTDMQSLAEFSVMLLKKVVLPLLIPVLIVLFLIMRCCFLLLSVLQRNPRKKAIFLWKHACRRLALAGLRRSGLPGNKAPDSEFALHTDTLVKGTYSMYLCSAAARFAPEYGENDFMDMQKTYHQFSQSYRKSIPALRRFLAWVLPPLSLIIPGKKGNVSLILLLSFTLFMGTDLGAQNGDGAPDADSLFRNAADAEYSEYWERAIDLYREGGISYPDDPRFPWALGNLYYSRALYGLAWDEYRKAESLNPWNTYILSRLANTAGYLNRNVTSVEYLERLLAIDPDSRDVIGRLGWMYFKIHRLEEGERLLVSAIERLGDDPDLSMTLATIYSDMYRYEEGKYWYKKTIAQTEMMREFTSVAHYNLAILESRFYHYDLSMDEANASLDSMYRSSGLLMRGELYLRRLDLENAQSDYDSARESDHSPLAKLNLAQTYQISGRLEEARLYAVDCLNGNDHSWMMHYGIDPVRYKRDIHEILYKTYSGLSKAERFRGQGSPGAFFRCVYKSASYRFYTEVHRKLYQKYCLAAGDAYNPYITQSDGSGSVPLERYIQYYNAFESYPRRALFWLNRARSFETSLIPAAIASYDLEEGILLKNNYLVASALDGFDPVWEKDLISHCYRHFAGAKSLPLQARRDAVEELFTLNRGALLQAELSLPANIRLDFSGAGRVISRRTQSLIQRALTNTGFYLVNEINSSRFRLEININSLSAGRYSVVCGLIDNENTLKPVYRTIPVQSLSKKEIYRTAGVFSTAVFTVE